MRFYTTALITLLVLGAAFGHQEQPNSDAVVPENPVLDKDFDDFMEETAQVGCTWPKWVSTVTSAVGAVVKAVVPGVGAVWEALQATANAAVNTIIEKVNDMSKPKGGAESKLITLGKVTKDSLGAVFTEVKNALNFHVEENLELIQMHQQNRQLISEKTGISPLKINIPDPKTVRFDISSSDNKVNWDSKEFNMDVPTEMSVVSNYLKGNKLVDLAKKVMKAAETLNTGFSAFSQLSGSSFKFEDSMLKGPACTIDSEALQFTVSAGMGFSSGVGAEAALEVGFQVGCMEGFADGKNWVIVPMWGFGLGISIGFASPGASIDGNLYHYKPFGYYKHFGHEMSIGASVGIGLVGVSVDQIFGCCSKPWQIGSQYPGPLRIEFKTEDSTWWPFGLADTRSGEHVSIQIIGTEEDVFLQETGKTHKVKKYQDLKFFSPSSGREIDISGKAPAMVETAVGSKAKTDEKGLIEVTIVAAYARACRHFNPFGDGFKGCFSKFGNENGAGI